MQFACPESASVDFPQFSFKIFLGICSGIFWGHPVHLDNPAYNYGGFFVDGSAPTIYRLPTVLILIYVTYILYKYLLKSHTKSQTIFAVILLGGLGGLTLDILAYGSVCDWLGFMIPGSRYYSLLNISDLMI